MEVSLQVKLTVKLSTPVLGTLPDRPAARLAGNDAHLSCSPTHEPEDKPEGYGKDWCHDSERSIAPTPSAVVEPGFTKLGTSLDMMMLVYVQPTFRKGTYEGVDNVGESSERHPDQTVLHKRGIGDENVEDVIDAVHAGPVDDLRSAKGLDVLA